MCWKACNWYIMRFFQRASVGFNNLWIHFILESLIVSICLKYLVQLSSQMERWAGCLGGHIFSCSRGNRIFFFGIFWNSKKLAYSFDKRVWFTIIFLPLKESLILFHIWIFYYAFIYFDQFGVIKNRITKVTSKYFNRNCAEAWILRICVS